MSFPCSKEIEKCRAARVQLPLKRRHSVVAENFSLSSKTAANIVLEPLSSFLSSSDRTTLVYGYAQVA